MRTFDVHEKRPSPFDRLRMTVAGDKVTHTRIVDLSKVK